MILDYHIHTQASPDGKGSMQEYVWRAKERRIDEIGFSDHVLLEHLEGRSDFLERMTRVYVENFLRFKEKSEIPVKLGAEVDFFPDKVERIRSFIEKFPFDYVIGSVHVIGKWIIDASSSKDEYSKRDPFRTYVEYFELVKELCKCRLFDVLGHPDLIKIFGTRPDRDLTQLYEETAEAIAQSDTCVEVNAKGLDRPCREIYPNEQFLRILNELDVPITFGSDAHKPDDVGLNLDQAVRLAKKVGYSHVSKLCCRERTSVEI